ncbi:MAG: HEAT repeat domain-containing protein [Candidatus Thiodiazotropha sp.]|nr:HEAT repeat domain-containing protein [Candidatus Thiodiazotropha sp.]MCM8881907.1 HEAT repeat domain-containing protein [Candidatus Thiodiazotropha sp.]MCM8918574.1 HEAT repeat domain-containing protein [Candidatus Thiodiazotropha sp.]
MSLQNETVDVLCELLETGDEADRCYAARTLGVLRSNIAVPFLIERLKDEDVDVCIDAAEALGRIGDEAAVPALTDSLQNDTSGEVCSMVTEALGKIASAECVDLLLNVLTERPEGLEWDGDWDTWWDIQLEAVKALGAVGAVKAVDSLVAFINDDAQQDIENEVLNALVSISGVGLDQVIERVQDTTNKRLSRRRAIHALAESHSPSSTRVLGRSLQDADPEVRAEAALALANQNAERYLSALVLMLRDQSGEVRDAAIKAVTQLAGQIRKSTDLQETLLPMLNDPSSQVRATLLNVLAPVVANNPLSNEHYKVVISSSFDSSAETAAAACRLLGENRNLDAISTLLEHARNQDGHPMVRREAILSIGQFGEISDEIINVLMNAVGDSQQPVRLAALTALMSLDEQRIETDELTQDKHTPPRPLSIIIDAVRGSIHVPDKATSVIEPEAIGNVQQAADNASEANVQNGVVVEFETEVETRFTETSNDSGILDNPVPQEIAETMTLPDGPTQIVEVGDVSPAMSTLDAIAMENVESMLDQGRPQQAMPEIDEATQEYLDVVEANKAEMKRIRSSKRITPNQDVRRLGTRVLAAANDDKAIEALILALNDQDDLIRREAAEAIGEIAQRDRENPKLMDAVGTLITQLAVGDLEQKIVSARSLSFLGNRSALASLMEALNDKQANVRIEAIHSLARLSCDGQDPTQSGHMVVRDIPSSSVARKLLECLDDDNIGVRVAATRGLSKVLPITDDETLTQRAVERIVASVSEFTGEEARLIGQALRTFDRSLSNQALLTQLKTAENSVKRSVFIEMIEEILNPDQAQPEQAA